MTRRHRRRAGGFTLVELLVALALTGLVLAALATVTAQWLPNWHRGIDRVETSEQVAIAVERIAADLAAAEVVPATLERRRALFEGSDGAVTFVRTALGPNARPGLEIVQIAETDGPNGPVLTRSTGLYAPRSVDAAPPVVGTPVVVLRPPYRVAFSFADADGQWRDQWRELDELPRAVRILVRDARTGQTLDVSTAVVVQAQLPARCVSEQDQHPCTGLSPSGAAPAPPASGGGPTQ